MGKKLLKILGKVSKVLLIMCCTVAAYAIFVNFFVIISGGRHIVAPEKVGDGYDCIIVPGCAIQGGEPSDMLRDRLDRAIELYNSGVSDKILLSGDHSSDYYNELAVMENYTLKQGVPADAIETDHSGFSTYETVYRAKNVYGVKKAVIVTQKYHLYRAVYLARRFGIDAVGVKSMPNTYVNQLYCSLREVLARNKDFLYAIFKPEPTAQ